MRSPGEFRPGDRVRVAQPRPAHVRLRGLEGTVKGWPGTEVRVRLDPAPRLERTLIYFRTSELALVAEGADS